MNINVESSRIVAAELHRAGHKSSGIIKETGYDASTVDRTVASLKQGNGIQRKTCSPKSDKKRIKRFLGGMKPGNGIQRKTHSPKSDKKRTKRFLGGLKLSIVTDLSLSMLNWQSGHFRSS